MRFISNAANHQDSGNRIMRTLGSLIALFILTLALAGCGGSSGCGSLSGGGSGTTAGGSCSSGTTTTAGVGSVTVVSASATVPTDGSSLAGLVITVKDANNATMSGVAVTLSASAGTVTAGSTTTNSSGQITATLSGQGVAAGTTITVTATAGSVSGKTTVSVVANSVTIGLTTNAPQIPSDGSSPATITAIVRDANNQLMSGVQVSFQATSGGIAPTTTSTGVTAGTTDSNGAAAAALTTANDPTNRTITVTATANGASATVTVQVVGTQLTITGPSSLVLGAAGTYSVALTNSANTGIASKSVSLTSSLGNPLSSATVTTDSTGHATFTLTANTAGTDNLSATAMGLTTTDSVAISNQDFEFTAPAANTLIPLGTPTSVSVLWKTGGAPQTNQPVTFSTTRGTFTGSAVQTTVNTDGTTGVATVSVSSTTAGPAVITATGTGVSAQLAVTFVANNPTVIDVQASPASIPTQGQSTITATLRDAQNNLVQGQTVNFQLADNTGGHLSVASAVTNSQGQAQTVYTASTSSSGSNGVTVTATSINTVTSATLSGSASLTVGGQSVFLSLGTGNTISENDNKTQFIMPFTVQAIDASGNAVNNATITLAIHPVAYGKGTYYQSGSAWQQSGSSTSATAITVCPNEDLNQNGILDPGEDGDTLTQAEINAGWIFNPDGNQNGKLDPGGVAATSAGTVTTANGGTAEFNVTYPEDHALWVKVQLVASTTVQGTQSSTSTTFWLPILATDLTSTTTTPPGYPSPYGVANVCTNPN